ncbi:PREDICTED: transmembrane protein 2-like [Branchiostoma belcheri]|uniref:Transmembrane protein 2-like n=1 Tax=Branchiostoma belcheri TaxID=7741 RepID=A0A6P4ZJZ0_BRABE|nr:PREDICTED: transmembrane protein 2-like [Branchiostoma belcheri]
MEALGTIIALLGMLDMVLGYVGCPDADASLTPWDPGHDETARVVISSGQNYLLIGSATFESLEIRGGKLVFADNGNDITLRARSILVGAAGELHVGSESCRYRAKATIVLFGRSDEGAEDPRFGRKFVGVEPGGTLEVHGQRKLSWTQLAKTVGEGGLPYGSFSAHERWEDCSTRAERGISVLVVDPATAARVDYGSFDTYLDWAESDRLVNFLDKIPDGFIVSMGVLAEGSEKLNTAAKNAIAALGSNVIHTLGFRQYWAFVAVKGDPNSAVEDTVMYSVTEDTPATADKVFTTSDGVEFRVSAASWWANGQKHLEMSVDAVSPDTVISLKDDVTSWQPGDRIVLASTDYNMEQAEEFQLVNCQECSTHQVKLAGKPKYTHFGEISGGVDMRGEVGLLTRNVVITAETEDSCYGNNFCQYFDYDTFGGHLKVVGGFTNVHLSGVEITRMGQQVLGSYPVHFHMAGDVDELGGYARPAYLDGLSIHHCFSRCVTIHGTHGLMVKDTVGYDTLGHCFFLEDGAEQRNTLDHNLGLVTRPGALLPTDRDEAMCRGIRTGVYGDYIPQHSECLAVSTFWIAHPNNNLINNVAAGSVHFGIWYLFHHEPTGLSAGTLPPGQAEHAPLGKFYNNRAHSNFRQGLMVDNGVKTTQASASHPAEFLSKITYIKYHPHVDSDPSKPRVPAVFDGFISYKNAGQASWLRGGDIVVKNCAVADTTDMTFASEGGPMGSGDEGALQVISNCVFVGESDNLGNCKDRGRDVSWAAGADGRFRTLSKGGQYPYRGFEIYDGPVAIENCTFRNFRVTSARPGVSALGFQLENQFQMAVSNAVINAKFEEVDLRVNFGAPGDRHFGQMNREGDKMGSFHDEDGSVTGYVGSHVFYSGNHLAKNPGCVERPDWNAMICSGNYAMLFMEVEKPSTNAMLLVRDEYPADPVTLEGLNQSPGNRQKHNPVITVDTSYTVHWTGRAPEKFKIYPAHFNKDNWVRLGLCYPPGTTFRVTYLIVNRVTGAQTDWQWIEPASDLAEVEQGDGFNYYWDDSTGLLFVKVKAHYARTGEKEYSYCSNMGCERIFIEATMTSNDVSNCMTSAYPKYGLSPSPGLPMMLSQHQCNDCGAKEPILLEENGAYVDVSVVSRGYSDMDLPGPAAAITVDGVSYDSNGAWGFNVVIVDAQDGSVTAHAVFMTNRDPSEDAACANFLRNDVPKNSVVLVSLYGNHIRYARDCLAALMEVGAEEPGIGIAVKASYALVGFKGGYRTNWIRQEAPRKGTGPAVIQTRIPLLY